jgi:hypothetical protein
LRYLDYFFLGLAVFVIKYCGSDSAHDHQGKQAKLGMKYGIARVEFARFAHP